MREERDREYREQRKGRGVEDKGQWRYDSGEERMMERREQDEGMKD